VIVLDSGSTDGTIAIVRGFANAVVRERPFDTFAGQCNFGLGLVETPWVLSLDADYVLSDALVGEIAALSPASDVGGYRTGFAYCVHGRRLRGTLYPPRTVLYRVAGAHYEDVGHSHRVRVAGGVTRLTGKIDHDDRKPLNRWLESQRRYAVQEASHLTSSTATDLGWADRLRLKLWVAPLAAIPYVLLARGCLFDGWPGWYYALQRAYAETLLAIELLDRRLAAGSED
jgi:glycosyltransferase involved in cell wall biosynthesis